MLAGLSGALASCLDFVDKTNIPKCYKARKEEGLRLVGVEAELDASILT